MISKNRFIFLVALWVAILFALILNIYHLPSDWDYAEAKARYDKDPYMQIEVWDNGRPNTSRVYTSDSIYSRTDSCIVFREHPYVNRTVACGDNIVVTKKEF